MAETPGSPVDGSGATEGPDIGPDFESIARHYRLLPHERFFAKRNFDQWTSTPELRRSAEEAGNGPVALVLVGALRAWGIPGGLLGLSGLGLLVASGGAAYAYWIGYAGIVMLVVGALRASPVYAAG